MDAQQRYLRNMNKKDHFSKVSETLNDNNSSVFSANREKKNVDQIEGRGHL